MKLLVDECCPLYLVEGLRQDGHDVFYVPEVSPSLEDAVLLQQALNEERIIVTEDNDFGELIFRQQLPAYGVVLIRISHNLSREERLKRVQDLFTHYSAHLPNKMTTLSIDAIRIRPLPTQID